MPDIELGLAPAGKYAMDTFRLSHPFYNGVEFFNYLNDEEGKLWIATYTASNRHLSLALSVERLLVCIGDFPAKHIRRLANIHLKLYILRRGNKTRSCWIGSQNLVNPSNLNIMIEVAGKYCGELTSYFDHLWQQGEK